MLVLALAACERGGGGGGSTPPKTISNAAPSDAAAAAPSEQQCKQLLDHLTDLEFQKTTGSAASEQKAAVTAKVGSEFVETCTKKMTRSRIECALAATDFDGVARCDEPIRASSGR